MFTSTHLKAIITEARPIIERQLDDAELIAGIRTKVTADGGDWGQVKALLKAMIQDERDEAGEGKRVAALLGKADHALGYADMLGLGNLNEKNSFDPPADDAPEPKTTHGGPTGEGSATSPAASLATTNSDAAVEKKPSRQAHNLEIAGASPAPATNPETHLGEPGASPSAAAAPVDGGAATAGEKPTPVVPSVPLTAADNARKIRPWCLRADDLTKCGGYGKTHCHSCLKAHADAEGLAA